MLLPEILRIPTWDATGKLGPLLGSQSFLIKEFKKNSKCKSRAGLLAFKRERGTGKE